MECQLVLIVRLAIRSLEPVQGGRLKAKPFQVAVEQRQHAQRAVVQSLDIDSASPFAVGIEDFFVTKQAGSQEQLLFRGGPKMSILRRQLLTSFCSCRARPA